MVVLSNHLGDINISKHFFATLIGSTVTSCFGVVDTNAGNIKQTLIESLPFFHKKKYIDKGVTVRFAGDKLFIELHITVLYGVNVSSIVKSIQNKVRFAVEEETDLTVEQVNVFVDGIKS